MKLGKLFCIKNGRMVVAGGRPNVVIESAVARCQLRYHAPFVTDSLPLFHAKQTNTLALRRMQGEALDKQHHCICRV